MVRHLLVLIIPSLIIFGCRSEGSGRMNTAFEVPDSILYQDALEVSEQAMEDIVQNISSPVEIAALIKALDVPFSRRYLAATSHADNFNTNFHQALGLGIYGADLGYLNMYSRTSVVLDYLSVIRNLSDAIRVGQFFDFHTLRRLATHSQNLDSLMYISVHSFNQMDRHLRENRRGNLSALIVAGVWIEGLYLATQVAKDNPHPDLAERIGEQKIILQDLMLILNNYKSDPQFAALIKDFETIRSHFTEVKITYERGDPEAIERDGMLVIIQNETSHVHITEEQLRKIIEITEKVRNNILANV